MSPIWPWTMQQQKERSSTTARLGNTDYFPLIFGFIFFYVFGRKRKWASKHPTWKFDQGEIVMPKTTGSVCSKSDPKKLQKRVNQWAADACWWMGWAKVSPGAPIFTDMQMHCKSTFKSQSMCVCVFLLVLLSISQSLWSQNLALRNLCVKISPQRFEFNCLLHNEVCLHRPARRCVLFHWAAVLSDGAHTGWWTGRSPQPKHSPVNRIQGKRFYSALELCVCVWERLSKVQEVYMKIFIRALLFFLRTKPPQLLKDLRQYKHLIFFLGSKIFAYNYINKIQLECISNQCIQYSRGPYIDMCKQSISRNRATLKG